MSCQKIKSVTYYMVLTRLRYALECDAGFLLGSPWLLVTVEKNARFWNKRTNKPARNSLVLPYPYAGYSTAEVIPFTSRISTNEKCQSGPTTILGSFLELYQKQYSFPNFLGLGFSK